MTLYLSCLMTVDLLEKDLVKRLLKYVATHKQIDVLGILAVASNTHHWEWARVDVSVDRNGNLTEYGVDKFGLPDGEIGRISGDTIYCLDDLNVPVIVGVGDIGKMCGNDEWERITYYEESNSINFGKEWFYDEA